MIEVPIGIRPAEQLRSMGRGEATSRYDALVHEAKERLDGRTIWHINATSDGGGVAELLRANLGYLSAEGIRLRWLVVEAERDFFEITKRIHNRLHGSLGDGGPLGPEERRRYDAVLASQLAEMPSDLRRGDIVVIHDPQPAGLIPGLAGGGPAVVWTCHVGVDLANDIARSAWAFLIDDLRAASAATFTRRAYVWEGLDEVTVDVIPPCIDPFSVKNVPLGRPDVASILVGAGILAGANHRVGFTRHDGTQGAIRHRAEMVEAAPTPSDAKVVVQVSRWDTLKDPVGVMAGFAQTPELDDAHLILAGPAPSSVGDDPEAVAVLEELRERWAGLREPMRRRIHIANLPADDVEENAVVVNALQRRADVVVQKSLAEGFGLTVTEAMWKARPVVASGLGGIRIRSTTASTVAWSILETSRRSNPPSPRSSGTRSRPHHSARTRNVEWKYGSSRPVTWVTTSASSWLSTQLVRSAIVPQSFRVELATSTRRPGARRLRPRIG